MGSTMKAMTARVMTGRVTTEMDEIDRDTTLRALITKVLIDWASTHRVMIARDSMPTVTIVPVEINEALTVMVSILTGLIALAEMQKDIVVMDLASMALTAKDSTGKGSVEIDMMHPDWTEQVTVASTTRTTSNNYESDWTMLINSYKKGSTVTPCMMPVSSWKTRFA